MIYSKVVELEILFRMVCKKGYFSFSRTTKKLLKPTGVKKNAVAVPVFPEKYSLELVKRHLVIDFLILGRFLILLEGLIPFGLIQWWNHADNGLPLNDRQPGMRKPRDPANHKNGKDHGATDKQPEGNLSPVVSVHSSTPSEKC